MKRTDVFGVKRLVIHVILQAIEDMAFPHNTRYSSTRHEGEYPADKWLAREDDLPCSPQWCCDVLGWSLSRLRKVIPQIVEGARNPKIAGKTGAARAEYIRKELGKAFGWRKVETIPPGVYNFGRMLSQKMAELGWSTGDWREVKTFCFGVE